MKWQTKGGETMDNQDSVRNVGLAAGQRGFLCMCSARVIYFLAAFLTLAVGLILGAVFAEEILPALPAVIAFAAVMAVLILALVVYRYCLCCRNRRCC
jgi:hypothetical protein